MKKSSIIILVLIIIIVCAAAGAGAFFVMNNMNKQPQQVSTSGSSSSSGSSTAGSGIGLTFEEDQSDVQRVVESKPGIVMPGWSQINIDADTTEVYVDFYNPEDNAGNYYMTFELVLADTGETLYKSKLIKAGDHVKKITLSRALSPGTYKATIKIQPYTADDKMTATNNAEYDLKLVAS